MQLPEFTVLDILFPTFEFVFDFWPFLLISALKGRKNLLKQMLSMWALWACVRVFLFWLFGISPGIPYIWDGIIGEKGREPDAESTRTQVKRYDLAASGYT